MIQWFSKAKSDWRWPSAAALALLAYFVGTLIAPLLYPYKMFISDTPSQIIAIQLIALRKIDTYLGWYALQGYLGWALIFAMTRYLFKAHFPGLQVLYFVGLGIYYNLMISGAMAGHLHAAFNDTIRPWLPVVTKMPLYLILPLLIMLGVPIFVAYVVSGLVNFRRKVQDEV